jgi:hypothetical protein
MLGASKQVGMYLSPKEIGVNLGSQIIHFICPDWYRKLIASLRKPSI